MPRPAHEIQPTLSDLVLFAKNPWHPLEKVVTGRIKKTVEIAHRNSRVFVFDEAATRRVGEICAYQPELIAELQEFARAPFPNTFIQLDATALMQGFREAGLKTTSMFGQPEDKLLGFLFTEQSIYTVTSDENNKVGWSPIIYKWHQPMTFAQEQRAQEEIGVSRVILDRFMWGSSYGHVNPAYHRALRAHNSIEFAMPEGWGNGKRHPMSGLLMGGGAGDLRTALCAMLLLIRPNLTLSVSTRPAQKKLVLGRPTTFLAHTVVTVKLTPDCLIKRTKQAAKEMAGRLGTRWHEVRGHYVHSHRAKVSGCAHDWLEMEPDKWECTMCGGRRAWRTYPEGKGDASIGVVTKHYVVQP
jgi:hypothetical protein